MYSSKFYDIAKWIAITLLPVLGWLYGELGPVWGWPYVQEIVLTADRLGVALAVLIGISDYNFKKANSVNIVPIETGDDSTAMVDEEEQP